MINCFKSQKDEGEEQRKEPYGDLREVWKKRGQGAQVGRDSQRLEGTCRDHFRSLNTVEVLKWRMRRKQVMINTSPSPSLAPLVTEGLHFPVLHSASVHCGEQQFAFTPSNTTANSSFWISLPWVLWPRHRPGTNPPLIPKFPWDQKGKGQGYEWWGTSLCWAECCKLQKTDVSLLLLQTPPFALI